jgi:hypothetical protein
MTKGAPTPNRVTIVLTDEAMEKLRDLARQNYRSISGQVSYLVAESIGFDPRPPKLKDDADE